MNGYRERGKNIRSIFMNLLFNGRFIFGIIAIYSRHRIEEKAQPPIGNMIMILNISKQ